MTLGNERYLYLFKSKSLISILIKRWIIYKLITDTNDFKRGLVHKGQRKFINFLMFLGTWRRVVLWRKIRVRISMAQERLKHLPKFTLCPGAQVSLLALPEMQSNKEKQLSPDYPWIHDPDSILRWWNGQASTSTRHTLSLRSGLFSEWSPFSAYEDLLTGTWG